MITVQIDSFEHSLPELKLIFPVHHDELGLFKSKMPLAPQYGEYIARERSGRLLLITARVDKEIAAYYTVQLAPGFHYGETLTATQDMIYIRPEFRGRGLALPLFRCVQKELRARGIQIWYSGFKTHNSLGMPELLKLFGFQDADTYLAKWIGD